MQQLDLIFATLYSIMCVCLYVPIIQRDIDVQISKARRGKHTKISPDNMSFSSAEGYRSVQSNRGTFFGTWFFEITLVHLGSTGHCRLGVGTARQEIDAPCGYTESSFGYRDVDGSKVHKAWREPFAEPYKEGDTIGCDTPVTCSVDLSRQS